jgi:hypothetical protein
MYRHGIRADKSENLMFIFFVFYFLILDEFSTKIAAAVVVAVEW